MWNTLKLSWMPQRFLGRFTISFFLAVLVASSSFGLLVPQRVSAADGDACEMTSFQGEQTARDGQTKAYRIFVHNTGGNEFNFMELRQSASPPEAAFNNTEEAENGNFTELDHNDVSTFFGTLNNDFPHHEVDDTYYYANNVVFGTDFEEMDIVAWASGDDPALYPDITMTECTGTPIHVVYSAVDCSEAGYGGIYPSCVPYSCPDGQEHLGGEPTYPDAIGECVDIGGGGGDPAPSEITERDKQIIALGLASMIGWLFIKQFRWRSRL